MYFPLNYQNINVAAGLNSPSSVKSYDNKSFWYWQRALFQRAAYRIEFDLGNETKSDDDLLADLVRKYM